MKKNEQKIGLIGKVAYKAAAAASIGGCVYIFHQPNMPEKVKQLKNKR
jgi:cyclic lactone autoinducer peptide